MTTQQKFEVAKNYRSSKHIDFGNIEANQNADEMFVAGYEVQEKEHVEQMKNFKDAFIEQYKFHCNELQALWKQIWELEKTTS